MEYLTKIGARNITVRVIADSVSKGNKRITTFEMEYPRMIHSELMTHRVFSRNAMSSRAIPIKKMIAQVMESPAKPVEFGKNKAGMQSAGAHNALIGAGYSAEAWWDLAALSAAKFAEGFADADYHKQVANRLLEPFQMMKTIVTATEFKNFFWLRVDEDADPTIRALATLMHEAYEESIPELLLAGEWHTPYVNHVYTPALGSGDYDPPEFEGYCVWDENGIPVSLTLSEALAISASCCAQVSYRILNTTKEKALDIYAKLLSGNKVHASPFEHQATPISDSVLDEDGRYFINTVEPSSWEQGVTHMDRTHQLWSGNLCGWVQHRQSVPNNVVLG